MDIIKIHEAIRKGYVNISEHADDKPFPSCLIYGRDKNDRHIHSVWAYSEEHEIAVLVTAYIPDPEKWLNYKIRKPKR